MNSESASGEILASDELIAKLRAALRRDGDFPASAKIVTELRMLTSDPKTTANQVTEVILKEPSLGTRVLHLVNSSFYRRVKPIMTVSQAVLQIGMKPLAELCAGLVLLQKFVPAARRGGSFANCLKRSVLTSLLSSTVATEALPSPTKKSSKGDEHGYLAGSFAELGTLLLAYYFPQVYESAVKRAEAKRIPIGQCIRELTGLSIYQLSLEVIDALDLPSFYKDILNSCDQLEQGSAPQGVSDEIIRISKSVGASRGIADAVISSKVKGELDQVISSVSSKFGLDMKGVGKVMGELPTVFREHCSSLDLQLTALPEFVSAYKPPGSAEAATEEAAPAASDQNQFANYVSEIRNAVENREPTASIITSVMETLAWALGFERVLLLLASGTRKSSLLGRLLLGNMPNFDPKSLVRSLGADAGPNAPDVKAFKESKPVFSGDPILPGGWPIAVLPVGFGARAIGVIYADKLGGTKGGGGLSEKEQAALSMLSELLDRSIILNS